MPIQLQEFAKHVLFGTTIEEKLGFPRDEIVDTAPGNPIKTPRTLSRPPHLTLREDGVRANHPKNAKLVDEKERGRLLHFFGNHELLATELMALVLLKFPEAPASFRRGVLETLKEEQIHTRLYIHRMKQCGVEFGELPLSDYFWKSVSSMEDPLDYVTRLSLTFEQANLDYSREYKKVFQSVGDETTANLLDRIYHDEIDHVGFGLKWFRRWKATGRSDWEAFRERLDFPLSPSRAKGNVFNKKGRIEAGLDEAFINDLQIFHQSRGRTPSVLWFNPDCETYAAQDSAKAFLTENSRLQRDLDILPLYYSRKDDILLVSKRPSREFLRSLQKAGFHLPEILTCEEGDIAPRIPRKIGELRPWGWTPDCIHFFQNSFESLTRPQKKDTLWNSETRQLFSKSWSVLFGKKLANESASLDWIAPAEIYGEAARGLDEMIALRSKLQKRGYENIVCKAPFGTAAREIRCIPANDALAPATYAWLEKTWKEQEVVIVEPWLDRVFDFSIQFEYRNNALKTIAFSRLVNNARGQFKGIITSGFCKGIDDEIARFLMTASNEKPRVYEWYEAVLSPALEKVLDASGFRGPLAIDALVYRSPKGNLQLKPIVELNPRFTMGRIGYELGERNAARSVGYFQIVTRTQLRKTGSPSFAAYSRQLSEEHPVQMTAESRPRIICGSFPLNDPTLATHFLALYHVRENLADLPIGTI